MAGLGAVGSGGTSYEARQFPSLGTLAFVRDGRR